MTFLRHVEDGKPSIPDIKNSYIIKWEDLEGKGKARELIGIIKMEEINGLKGVHMH